MPIRDIYKGRVVHLTVEDFVLPNGHPMEIEISTSLIRLADPKRGGELLERIRNVRQYVATNIGIVMPKVRIRDNHRFDRDGYRIKIADAAVAEGTLMPTRLLALQKVTPCGGTNLGRRAPG